MKKASQRDRTWNPLNCFTTDDDESLSNGNIAADFSLHDDSSYDDEIAFNQSRRSQTTITSIDKSQVTTLGKVDSDVIIQHYSQRIVDLENECQTLRLASSKNSEAIEKYKQALKDIEDKSESRNIVIKNDSETIDKCHQRIRELEEECQSLRSSNKRATEAIEKYVTNIVELEDECRLLRNLITDEKQKHVKDVKTTCIPDPEDSCSTPPRNSWFWPKEEAQAQAQAQYSREIDRVKLQIRHQSDIQDRIISDLKEQVCMNQDLYLMSYEDKLVSLLRIAELRDYSGRLEDRAAYLSRTSDELLNRVFKLQGHLRVICRVKPPSPTTKSDGKSSSASCLITYPDFNKMDFNGAIFEYDRVLPPTVTQSECFREIECLVEPVMGGCRACIFAYGTTGSGKTYTMQGPPDDPGVIFRAIQRIFSFAAMDLEFKTLVTVSMLEIYNERVVDLLAFMSDPKSNPMAINMNSASYLDIRKGKDGIVVEGLKERQADNPDEVLSLIRSGTVHRSTGCNNVNEHSSRSHLVVIIKVVRSHYSGGYSNSGMLYLVDLAGSERIKFTAAKGSRLKEAQHINKSLSALGDVISALASGNKHVPYRNSKLTWLLHDVLNANAHVMMIVNISPEPEYQAENMYSLQFASRCRAIQMLHYRRNVTYTDTDVESPSFDMAVDDNVSVSSTSNQSVRSISASCTPDRSTTGREFYSTPGFINSSAAMAVMSREKRQSNKKWSPRQEWQA